MKKEQKYPTEVAEILDIAKEQYDKIKDDDKSLKKLKQANSDRIMANALKDGKKQKSKEKSKEISPEKTKQKMKMTQRL